MNIDELLEMITADISDHDPITCFCDLCRTYDTVYNLYQQLGEASLLQVIGIIAERTATHDFENCICENCVGCKVIDNYLGKLQA